MIQRGPRSKTIVVECKQSRSDFLRETNDTERLIEVRRRLHVVRNRLEVELIRANEPHLRRSGTALFHDLEEWDYSASRLPTYRAVLRELRMLDNAIHGGTKFWAMSRYRIADAAFLAAPVGMIRARELPPGWGLLEATRDSLRNQNSGWTALRVAVPALETPAPQVHRDRMLREIAAAATRDSGVIEEIRRGRAATAMLFDDHAGNSARTWGDRRLVEARIQTDNRSSAPVRLPPV
ncbi:MAG: hypothetical protein KF745_11030 [Phycisphaeraceae bacterium]|nr:hypothetical protein [Phycisphaeraceae bacterium]